MIELKGTTEGEAKSLLRDQHGVVIPPDHTIRTIFVVAPSQANFATVSKSTTCVWPMKNSEDTKSEPPGRCASHCV